ncbi:MAG: TonB-dependent receptor [Sphingobacteriales bacterium]|nr:TonB-dependent receptor [Sphingobacteriales bacterium]
MFTFNDASMLKNKIRYLIFSVVLLSFYSNFLSAQSSVNNKIISISFGKEPLEEALIKLQTDSKISLSFDPLILSQITIGPKSFSNSSLKEVLDYLLSATPFLYKQVGDALIILPPEKRDFTLHGQIQDRNTGEDLIGASITLSAINTGVTTNQYGFYSLTVPSGKYEISISHVGYSTAITQITLTQSSNLDFDLGRQPILLNEVNVQSKHFKSDSIHSNSFVSVSLDDIKKTPFYAGEVDMVKALQMQNGVNAMTEGSSGLFVRGGNIDQNVMLLDEAVVYNPSHLFGLVSVFNPDAVKSIQLYKDNIPANLGGRLSSVIDTRMDEGNMNEFHVKGGASLLSARLALEGPIKKNKSSFLIAYRRGLLDLYNNNFKFSNLNSSYYDINVKTNIKVSENNRLFYSMYYGNDHLLSQNTYANNWGNFISTFRWNHIFNPKLFFNLSSNYSNYRNQLNIGKDTLGKTTNWETGISDIGLRGDFIYYYRPDNEIKVGFNTTLHQFNPGELSNDIEKFSIQKANAIDYSLYFSNSISLLRNLKAVYGLRSSLFQNISSNLYKLNNLYQPVESDERFKIYYGLEPRIQLTFNASKRKQATISYNRTYQYMQLVQNNELAYSSLETWIPSSPNIKPQKADFLALSYQYRFSIYKLNIASYYKKMYNQLDLIDHAQIIQNPVIESELRSGKSTAYGTEINISANKGKFSSELAYSFSRVYKQITGINEGIKYPANYDLPHDLKLNISYQLIPRLSFNSFFIYTSGRPATLPVGYYSEEGNKIPIYEGKNSSRFPDYHRLDISAELRPKHDENSFRRFRSTYTFGIYNIYSRRNPLFYRLDQNEISRGLGSEESFSGIFPSFSYSFKF